jgi:hypothetical protein
LTRPADAKAFSSAPRFGPSGNIVGVYGVVEEAPSQESSPELRLCETE